LRKAGTARTRRLTVVEEGQNGQHAAVIGVRGWQAELAEDVADVLLDGAL
jgi:hypothetical protein